jgi:hypothetical protein
MEGLVDFAAVGGAIVVSLGIALSLEWFALNAVMKMMPARQTSVDSEAAVAEQAATGPALVATRFVERKRAA